MQLTTEYPVEVMQELETIKHRIGTASINLYAAGTIMREVRAKHLIADFDRISEILPHQVGRPKAIGPVNVSGDLGRNIINAMITWLSEEEMTALWASVLVDGSFEAEDLLTDGTFNQILLNHSEAMRLIFEIPDSDGIIALSELSSFLLQFATTSNCFSVYVLGDTEKLLKLIAPLALRDVTILPD